MERVISPFARAVWDLASRQHGVVARWQLLELGMSRASIGRRIGGGRLHRVAPGVYAVGRPGIDRLGTLMAAVLSCGPGAVLSHLSAAALWGFLPKYPSVVHVSVRQGQPRHAGIIAHRRRRLTSRMTTRHLGIPVTTPFETFLDIACMLSREQLERAIGDADRLGVIKTETLRILVAQQPGRRGAKRLRLLLDRQTFRLTHTVLEQRFLAIVRRTPLPLPDTQVKRGEYRVDFIWSGLGLVVETDGFTYHRTAAQQSEDARRDHFHLSEGRTPVRFSHEQVRFEASHVESTLMAVAQRLSTA